MLTVHAERNRPSDDDVELLIGERPTGTFSRQLFLAETLDSERIAADYTDGVLQLRVPVKEQAKPRRSRHRRRRRSATSIAANSPTTSPRACREPSALAFVSRPSGAAPSSDEPGPPPVHRPR